MAEQGAYDGRRGIGKAMEPVGARGRHPSQLLETVLGRPSPPSGLCDRNYSRFEAKILATLLT
jgi:hypothetical protein